MINSKYFLKGILCAKEFDSPAIALGLSFLAIGALLKNLGFTIQESIFSTFLTYALPGSLVMAESILIGVSLLNLFFAVWLVNARLYPMTVSLMPLLKHESQPKWKFYISCHFVAVSSWLILQNNYKEIEQKYRVDFWIGIGTATWLIAIFSTIIGIGAGAVQGFFGGWTDLIFQRFGDHRGKYKELPEDFNHPLAKLSLIHI